MIYKVGQLLTLGQKDFKYELLSYEGEYRRASDLVRVFPVAKDKVTEDGRGHAYYEVWSCLNLNTGAVEQKKLPVYVFVETSDDYCGNDRQEVIDDSNEVTSLLDQYQCWYDRRRTGDNFHLKIINNRHQEQITKLRDLDSQQLDTNYKVGIRLKLIQKEHPNNATRKNFIQWGNDFPDLLTKLKKDVYQMGNNISNNTNDTVTSI